MKELIRVYIFDGYRETVIESQVFNWAAALREIGLKTIGLSLTERKANQERKQAMLQHLSEKYQTEIYSGQYDNYPILREFQIAVSLYKLYKKLNDKERKIVFQTRMLGLIRIVPLWHLLTKAKFIFDIRASALTEYLYSNANAKHSDFRIKNLERIERQVVYRSDAVFCVSQKLKDYLLTNYGSGLSNQDKITVIPGAADQALFYYSDELRTIMRGKIGCENKTVFIYSGRLNKKWQVPDKVFGLFGFLAKRIPEVYFIILSPDVDIARHYFALNGIPETSYLVTYEELDGINQYLNAADYAIMLRENLPINHHASPTKVAEYLLTGLSVIISKNVGDFSEFIDEHGLGCIVDSDNSDFYEFVYKYIEQRKLDNNYLSRRKEQAEFSARFYSKNSYLELMKQKCEEL